jgi:chromosome segregation ATPase
MTVATVLAGFCVGLGVGSVSAQSLGDLAEREKARRKGESKRVITDEDLAKGSRTTKAAADDGAAGDTGTAAAKEAGPASKGPSEEERREQARKAWEERRKKAEDEVAQLTKQVDELQQQVSDQRVYQLGPNRARRLDDLQQAQDRLAAAQQRLDDLEDERRREGY